MTGAWEKFPNNLLGAFPYVDDTRCNRCITDPALDCGFLQADLGSIYKWAIDVFGSGLGKQTNLTFRTFPLTTLL